MACQHSTRRHNSPPVLKCLPTICLPLISGGFHSVTLDLHFKGYKCQRRNSTYEFVVVLTMEAARACVEWVQVNVMKDKIYVKIVIFSFEVSVLKILLFFRLQRKEWKMNNTTHPYTPPLPTHTHTQPHLSNILKKRGLFCVWRDKIRKMNDKTLKKYI